ncbi:MAG TPA: hypothetical protein VFK30_16885 [Anaerolineae bacterium]|nr:hypothetical protein [Anaerolineae bacterium]
MELKRQTISPDSILRNFLALEELYGRHNTGKLIVAIITSVMLLLLVTLMVVSHNPL